MFKTGLWKKKKSVQPTALPIMPPTIPPPIPSAKELQLLLDKKESLAIAETRSNIARYFNEVRHPLEASDNYRGYGTHYPLSHVLKLRNELELLGYELIEGEEKVHDTEFINNGLYGTHTFKTLDTFKMCKTITVRIKQ